MQLHPMKKIEIVVQAPILPQVLESITERGATRYTVLEALSGRGHFGEWSVDQLSGATRHVVVVVIAAADTAEGIVETIGELFTEYHGIITVSDVQVRRADYF